MDLSVKQKLWAFAAFSIVATLVVGLVGYHGEKAQGEALKVLNVQLSALRNHMEADMMHDALRADVLSALRAAASGDADARREVESDLAEHIANFEAAVGANQALPLSGDVKDALASVTPALQAYEAAANTIVQQAFADASAAEKQMPEFLVAFSALEEEMGKVSDLVEDKAKGAEAAATALAARSVMMMSVVILGAAITALLVSYFLVRSVVSPLETLRAAIEALRGGDSNGTRLAGFTHEFSGVETAFNGVLDDLDEQHRAEQLRAQAAFRVQQALNAATTNVVLTDDRLEVVYVNDTAREMFARYAADLRKDLPGFDTAQMLGRGIEQFYVDRGMRDTLQRLTSPRTDEVVLGGKTFSITATPVRDEQGQQLGVVCEWVDLTEQREAERQIQAVLDDATAGRLDSRLEAERFRGFTRALALSVNQMMDAVTAPLNVAAAHLSAIADGKLPAPITAEFRGAFNDIKNNLNTCSEVLRAMIEDATSLVEAAQAGRLDERASLDRHWGDFRKIVEGMNNMLDSMAQPITAARTVMTALAAGDLSKRMEGEYQGEFAVLRDAMDASIANLANMVKRIGDSSSSIGSSASEIAKGNQDLNRRTQEQAASIEETTSAIQSLTTRVQENTENARRANQLAASARTEAEKGGKVVADAVGAMSEINSASAKIADIISVIDGIAFQTNLLALNAAVEAARAGEQGRGFAVVASEVRNLAQNSAAAAKEIKDLIGDSVDKVNHGSQLVNESGSTLRDIVGAVKNVSDIIAEITAASEEQQVGIEQVNRALTQLDEVTQQNAALVEEATAASESMDDETRSLTDLMAFFKGGAADGTTNQVEAADTQAPRVERRKASRPWSERTAPAPAPAASMIAAGGNGSDVWNEF